jgi:PRC-barrel domain
MNIAARETNSLIGSDKVEGTSVFSTNGERIGAIECVMIGKVNGRVAYAVLGFGGFLGIGDDHYPLPWSTLRYDSDLGGYRADITAEQLDGAPKFRNESEWNWEQRSRAVDDYYGVPAIL